MSVQMQPLWFPDEKARRGSQIGKFIERAGFVADGPGYGEAHAWSVKDPGAFWRQIWDDLGVIGSPGGIDFDSGEDMLSARFFPEAKLNFAENLLRRSDDGEAIVFKPEVGEVRRLSWSALGAQVAALAAALKEAGVGPGDRVAAVMPNMPETVVAMLATTSLGGVFSSASPDFGDAAILDRFGQIEPVVLMTCDHYFYNGKQFAMEDKIASVRDGMTSLKAVIVCPYDGENVHGDWEFAKRLPDLLTNHAGASLCFTPMAFRDPVYILFSSGTTGKPKCIVHSVGGTLLQHLKEHRLHCDIRRDDRVFYFTTCGWMMWNWLVSALASEATLLLYDGSPFHRAPDVLFDFVAEERATYMGVSAKYIDAIRKQKLALGDGHNLENLRAIGSTGSPLAPEGFDYIYACVKADVMLGSICGGTDIVSCFIGCNPLLPVYRGEIQGAPLGMDVAIVDDAGTPVAGERGELVCRTAFPSMPTGFWNDPEGERYKASYFERFAGIWCQGDIGLQTPRGGFEILGRSDAVLNPGGVRIGTAEIYRQVEAMDAVLEAVAVGQQWDNDVRVVLFVILKDGEAMTAKLQEQIRKAIRTGASPRHVPAKIIAVADIPRTRSGKIAELAVRDVLHGKAIVNASALQNPEALALYENLPELL